MSENGSGSLIIKRKGEDGYKVVSIRMKEEMLEKIDSLAREANYSRNEFITLMLDRGIQIVKIQS